MRVFLQDIRYAVRQLRKSPGFTVTAVLTLALGIGATTAIFSTVYGLLLKSLPFTDAERIVALGETHPQVKGGTEATYPDYQDWRAQQKTFAQIGAYSTLNPNTISLTMDGRSEQVHRVLASGNFFSVLGLSAQIGRMINEHDDVSGNNHVAVLSSDAWQRYFSGDPSVVGSNVDLNGASYTIVGVLPAGAAYPAEGEVWLPLSLLDQPTQASRVWHSVNVLGRLRPGVGLQEARADMETVAGRLAAAYPATNRNEGVLLAPLREQLVGSLRPALLSLLGAVVLVLLIACANVANLLMVRAAANRREIAVRQALGASRGRLFSQFLAQTLVLCLLGGALGTLLAACALPLLRLALSHAAGLDLSMIHSVSLSVPVLLFTLGICTFTALLFGLLPLMRRASNLTEALHPGDRGSTGAKSWSRGALVAGEIAVAVVVLFLSTLVIRSFQKLLAVDTGFRTDHLLSAEITLPEPQYPQGGPEANRFYERVLEKVALSPSVRSAASINVLPLKPSQVMTRFLIEGAPAPAPGAFPLAQIRYVSPDFFKTMGIGLKEGRVFEQKDIDQPNFFVVNEAFAQRYLAGRDPLGAKVIVGVLSANPSKVPVVGVVANAHDQGMDTEALPEIYAPGFGPHAVLLVRSAVDPEGMVSVVKNAVHGLDPKLPIYHVLTLDGLLSDSVARQRMTAELLGLFAFVALALAAIGIYGVLSYMVVQRTREIGVRMAVGADREDILRLVLGQAGRFAAVGIVAGLAVALAGARLINGLLFHTSTIDPLSVSITIAGLALIAAVAVSVPASRAASVDPTEALRAE
ncbi:putative permease [Edaphobacter aggregans]|uniref:Putative permease n=1 Tax=Edaphobacter aggregans TaxID=570835 RepID=A0A3R9R3S0_9BACT|nr:ABC transporter permease [Edaphobacter aggregans]RSL17252.1 putative permease [Edaphobacter aggregans]